MAERVQRSAGVSTREIDLSGPSTTGPVGVPAGIIGTSLDGPAFVPITVANFTEFKNVFGATNGEQFGPLAASEWLRTAQALTYVKILGVGDGKKRSTSTGNVTNAGFYVGDPLVQDNGIVADNKYANDGVGTLLGRTYFLGCFMSESNGGTIFSDAGIQSSTETRAAAVAGLKTVQHLTGAILLTDTNGITKSYHFHSGSNLDPIGANGAGLPAGVIVKSDGVSAADIATNFIACLGDSDGHGGSMTGGTVSTLAHFTQSNGGVFGNKLITAVSTGVAAAAAVKTTTIFSDSTFASGSTIGGAVPILRGVLLAPSGVILHLSGNSCATTTKPTDGGTARSAETVLGGRTGGVTGSLDILSQEFVMLMNGYKGTSSKFTHVTASFDMTAPNYFANVLNTNPQKIEESGHLLYGHYDIYPDLAVVTGSHQIQPSTYDKEDIALLLTASIPRTTVNASAGSSTIPVYESFEDRFSTANSPFIISQAYGNSPYSLFRVHSLSDGDEISNKYKISIENIKKSTSDTDDFGSFSLTVRDFNDSDDEKVVLESFRGLSLDPGSDRYVARAIGDRSIFYNFDNDLESQKIVVDGSHPVRSRYIRVEMSDAVKKKEVPDDALPLGFRGPNHLVTSGSILTSDNSKMYSSVSTVQRLVEPPIPYRETVAQGTGIQKRSDSRLYWGLQTTRKTSITKPNLVGLPDKSILTYVKHFPNHRNDTINFSVGNNPGKADASGAILDCDRFNNNKFSLENVMVRTGSDTLADVEHWLSASYTRNGSIAANETNKTRAFKVDDLGKTGNVKFAKFTVPLQGGFDGLNLFNSDKYKLNNNAAKREVDDESNQGGTAGPTVSAYRKAIDIMSSKTDVEIQLLAIPGARHSSITDYAINATEQRFDAMYIMDIEERDQVNSVVTSSAASPHVLNTVTAFKNRALDSSFAAAYFPDVQITDPTTNAGVKVPPSVSVLGAYAINDKIGHPWFAPAGFTRGALSVINSAVPLNRTNLDDLYEADINPITAFPGTGVTVWGQKTLLASQSALDRVNVRRLLINVRRKVRQVANSLLFEPNRSETLEKFSSLVNPILQTVQEQSGVDRFKVVIDTTTTTQADVENNTIRGKIFLQPTRSVEFISLDFVVTNAGSELL